MTGSKNTLSALEQEIMDLYHQLDEDAQARVRARLEQIVQSEQAEKAKSDREAQSRAGEDDE